MNWVDLVVLAVLALSGLVALMRGLVREVLGLSAWVIAGVAAGPHGAFPHVRPWVGEQFSDPTTADLVAFGGVFLLILVVLWIIAGILGNAVRGSILGGLDRMLGLLFGLARGAVGVMVAYVLVGMAIPAEQWPPAVLEARALPVVHRGAIWLAGQIPPSYRPAVATPPAGRPTTSAFLLQPAPNGRLPGASPVRE